MNNKQLSTVTAVRTSAIKKVAAMTAWMLLGSAAISAILAWVATS
ncbi:MAG: hypothetical protein WC473_04525 [Patescibacteria group bacterium]